MTTLAQLIGQTRRMLSDFNQRGSASATGDAAQTVWRLPNENILGNDTVLAATALAATTQTITDEIVDPPFYGALKVQGGAAGMTGTVTVTGTSWDGSAATEDFTLSGTTVDTGTTKFKTVTSIALPVLTNDVTDTVTVATGTSVVCTVATVANTSWIVDYDTGWLEFDSAPADAAAIVWNYQYTHFPHDSIFNAINHGVDRLFPFFYVVDVDTTLSTVTGTYEYTMQTGTEDVVSVEWRSSSTYPWTPLLRRRYRFQKHGTARTLILRDSPPAGSLRVCYIKRPALFTADSDSLTDLELPDRAAGPLITFASWWLLNERLAARAQSDEAIANLGEGAAPIAEMQRAAAAFRIAFESEVQFKRMHPWSAA